MQALVQLWQADYIDLFFADETGFGLTPNIPYGWFPIGEQAVFPTQRKHVLNVFGFMCPTNRLRAYYTKDYIDSAYIIQCMDDFVSQIDKPTVVIWDNAPWHTAQAILDKRNEWEAKGLYLFYQPKYSPHFNKVETLWRKVKNEWLRPKHYKSANTLKKAVLEILATFGSEYVINFSMNY